MLCALHSVPGANKMKNNRSNWSHSTRARERNMRRECSPSDGAANHIVAIVLKTELQNLQIFLLQVRCIVGVCLIAITAFYTCYCRMHGLL